MAPDPVWQCTPLSNCYNQVNSDLTKPCETQKGTRQGCPLSPLLFILLLKVLNRDIRQDEEITGLKIQKKTYKLRVVAVYLVLISQKPQNGIEYFANKLKDLNRIE